MQAVMAARRAGGAAQGTSVPRAIAHGEGLEDGRERHQVLEQASSTWQQTAPSMSARHEMTRAITHAARAHECERARRAAGQAGDGGAKGRSKRVPTSGGTAGRGAGGGGGCIGKANAVGRPPTGCPSARCMVPGSGFRTFSRAMEPMGSGFRTFGRAMEPMGSGFRTFGRAMEPMGSGFHTVSS
jgi:hypothetical protein